MHDFGKKSASNSHTHPVRVTPTRMCN